MSRASWNFRNRVGKYELGRVLGEGSFGKVHLARDVETGEKRAIKVINKDRVVKDMMVAQIKREISTMKLAKHPNVVHLFEVMASKTKIYFVLEYVTGGELFDKIAKQGKLREEEARKYFQQLINAVDYCHSKGVYHRDLKLENLLLDEDGNLKISDFGLSALPQQVREDGLLHTTCGTPNYVAPEVIVDKGYDGAKADIWSCGVVLFVLMAGYLPFDEPNIMNLYKKIYRADFTCPDWFSSAARRLIIRILEPNPKNDCTLSDQKEEKDRRPSFLNAFDIISLSEGLNLSGLFEKEQGVRREMRFTLRCSASEILAKMEESAKPLGFSVKRRDYKVKMRLEGRDLGRKGHLTISTEVLEVSPLLSVVEMKKAGGDALEFDRDFQSDFQGNRRMKNAVATQQFRILLFPCSAGRPHCVSCLV
ncbi:CBL-interacting serine/threonine-protein kinase 23-like isoform X9 [Magnolia sinica]|uniref:CBL-interacting serine/threonine-protein kinase 23-like isoform X9 n=1 Tax=Magnolia sinica TaxID=86752 RepID=UPI0026599EC2|nr:CBL-interacting serine/threonine-protein kinase 23-like isoform X9 [Magnolia sinica]